MTSTTKRKRTAGRIAALEEKLLPPPRLNVYWVPQEPLAADEEYVLVSEEQTPKGYLRTLEKRRKQQ